MSVRHTEGDYSNWRESWPNPGAAANQNQLVVALFLVDQQQVGLDMAFAASCPIAGQVMVALACVQHLIAHQCVDNRLQIVAERCLV